MDDLLTSCLLWIDSLGLDALAPTPLERAALLLSLRTALWAALATLIPGVALGWWFAQPRSRGPVTRLLRWLIESAVMIPLVLPPVVTGMLLLMLFSPASPVGRFVEETLGLRVVFAPLGLVIAAAVVALPLTVRACRVAFSGRVREFEDAAATLGATQWRIFSTVSAPLAVNGVTSGLILAFARALGEFGATIMIAGNIPELTQTIPLAIYSELQSTGGEAQAWRLVGFSVALAVVTMALGNWLESRSHRSAR